MANILSKVGQSFNVPVHIYEADTEEDMNTIDMQGVPMGSKCHIINNGKWYMLNSEGKWRAMPTGGGSGSVAVDSTLTVSGQAADAKATGDAIRSLSEEIADIPSGKDGVGIQSVAQTTTSTEDGGTNVVTVTKTDGTTSTFSIKNGSKGSTGQAGADGHTPIKGTDYWTEADQQSIVDDVLAALPTWTGGSY